jgi:hypothetical protein
MPTLLCAGVILLGLQWGFLAGCTGFTTVDLSPLSQVTVLPEAFLYGCTGLTSVDLSPLSQVTEVHEGFLEGCPQITTVDNIPPLCAPPYGWRLKNSPSQWVRK